MVRRCPDCDCEMWNAEPGTYYRETPLKVRTDEPHEGRLGKALGLNKAAKVEGYVCPECRRVLLYAEER